jgi:16S rRNA (guanine527-N7)-methyltransferase
VNLAVTPELIETLRDAQRLGFFGRAPIEEMVEHAAGFVTALTGLVSGRVIDLGAGGGLPGLVLAEARPTWSVILLDRRQKRADFLERAVRRLGLGNAEVWCRDVSDVIDDVRAGRCAPFDAATARGFGPPDVTLRSASALIGPRGTIVISEPPAGDRWPPSLLAELGLAGAVHGHVRAFRPVA